MTGGGACQYLLSISCRTSREGKAKLSYVRALVALLYWLSCMACFALLMLWEEEADADICSSLCLMKHWLSFRAPDHRAARSPSDQFWRWDFTHCQISRQCRRCLAAGLASMHLANIKRRIHWESSSGNSPPMRDSH